MRNRLALLGLIIGLGLAYPVEARDGDKSVTGGSNGTSAGDTNNESKKEREAYWDQRYNDWLDAYEAWSAGAEDEETLDNFTDGATLSTQIEQDKLEKNISKDYELPGPSYQDLVP
jgi:hypothetical protein